MWCVAAEEHAVFFSFIHSTELFKYNEVMPFLTAPDTDVMNISFSPVLNFSALGEHSVSWRGIHNTERNHIQTLRLDWACASFDADNDITFWLVCVLYNPAWRGLTGCEFLIANSQDRISCNSNQGHLRWAYACLPPWPTALKGSLCCGLPSPVTWLLWKCPLPPPPSLFPVNCLKGGGWVRVKPASL